MTSARSVEPLDEPFDVVVELPGSKSLTNRALVCAALADGHSELTGVLFADDTEAMLDNVRRLGADVRIGGGGARVEVEGMVGKLRSGPVDLDARAQRHHGAVSAAGVGVGSWSVSSRWCGPVAGPADG